MTDNDVINKIIREIPNCSKITNADESLYNEFLKTEGKKYPYHYSRSWIFIKQISNGYGIKYFDKQKEHLITIAPNWGSTIPNYVYLPLGVHAIESVPNLLKELGRILKQKIIVKKVYGDENKNYLLEHGFQEVPSTGNIDFGNLDDDKYPEIVCDVDSIIKATFGLPLDLKMISFKRHIKYIQKAVFFNEKSFQEKNLTKSLEEPFKELVNVWSSDIAERTAKQFKVGANPQEIKQWMAAVYYPHFIEEYADKADNQKLISYLTFIDGKPAAFTSAYPISNLCLAVNASFCDINYPGLIQYQFFRLAVRARILGYKYLNLGSNDVESQHRYKSEMGKIYEVHPFILEFKST